MPIAPPAGKHSSSESFHWPSLTEFRPEAPGDEVVGPAPLDLAIGADGGHGEGGDDCDHAREEDDDSSQTDPCLTHHPAQSDEQHHAPDVQQTPNLREGTPSYTLMWV